MPNLMWFITNHCNLNCLNCSSQCDENINKYFTSIELIEKILIHLKTNKIEFETIDITGGEPLLHPDIEIICQLIHYYFPNSYINIYTNGLIIEKIQNLSFLKSSYITLNISIYPKINFLKKYEKLFNILHNLKINYEVIRVHTLFNQANFTNTTITSPIDTKCPMLSNNSLIYYLKNDILFPCCEGIELGDNFSFADNSIFNFKSIDHINKKYISTNNICSICHNNIKVSTYPWISKSDVLQTSNIIKNSQHFLLYKNNYNIYYNLYFNNDNENSIIVYHPLIKKYLKNDSCLYEKKFLEIKYLTGKLDILIYYNHFIDIFKSINYLKQQTILSECNCYFIKNISVPYSNDDEILYQNFLPFSSMNFNSYFLQASNEEEAKKLFLKHSFLKRKITLDINNFIKLKNSKFLEREYHNQ